MKTLICAALLCALISVYWNEYTDSQTAKAAEVTAKPDPAELRRIKAEGEEQARKIALTSCLLNADSDRWEYLKLNGRYNAKKDTVWAPLYVTQAADAKRAIDVNECQIQYGAR